MGCGLSQYVWQTAFSDFDGLVLLKWILISSAIFHTPPQVVLLFLQAVQACL